MAAPTSSLYSLADSTLFPQFLATGPHVGAELTVEAAEFSAYPNPVVRATTVRFAVEQAGSVQVRLYNALGQVVTTLYDRPLAAGQMLERPLGATGLAAGVYTCRLSEAGPTRTLKPVVSP